MESEMTSQPTFCCPCMAHLFSSGEIRLQSINQAGDLVATFRRCDWFPIINYCPFCGKEFHLTFSDTGAFKT